MPTLACGLLDTLLAFLTRKSARPLKAIPILNGGLLTGASSKPD